MTQADKGGSTREPEDGNQGARRPEHGGQTASLPTKGKNPRPTKDKEIAKQNNTLQR